MREYKKSVAQRSDRNASQLLIFKNLRINIWYKTINTKIKSEAVYALLLCISKKRQERYAIQLWLEKASYSGNAQYGKRIEYSHFHSGSVYISIFERNLLMLPHGCWMTAEEENMVRLKKVQAVKQMLHKHQVRPFKHSWSVSKYLHRFFALLWAAPLEDLYEMMKQ